ncbi:MAG: hypothetical protein Q9226_008134 [Calogaya cf. arnoldii]
MQRLSYLSTATCRPLLRASHKCRTPSVATSSTPLNIRPLSQTTYFSYPRKDSQDKDSLQPEATEYSKSGTDDAAARQEDTAFDPGVTDPGAEKDKVGDKTGASNNPLEVSPANPDLWDGERTGKIEWWGEPEEREQGGLKGAVEGLGCRASPVYQHRSNMHSAAVKKRWALRALCPHEGKKISEIAMAFLSILSKHQFYSDSVQSSTTRGF